MGSSPSSGSGSSGTPRRRTTHPRVLLIDRCATATVTIGGISVILAVLGILVYLVAVVTPLFSGASISDPVSLSILDPEETGELLFSEIDEYRTLGVCLLRSGDLVEFSVDGSRPTVRTRVIPPYPSVTAFSRASSGGHLALGFADGTIRLGRIAFQTSFDAEGNRQVSVVAEIREPFSVGATGAPLAILDYRVMDGASRLAALTADGRLLVNEVTERENLLTGEIVTEVFSSPVVLPSDLLERGSPQELLLTSPGSQIYLAWRDGTAVRYDLRNRDAPLLAERFDLTPEPDVTLTALRFMLGEQSVVAADSSGTTRIWFRVERTGAGADGYQMVVAHILAMHHAPVRAIGTSDRDKSLLTGDETGDLILHHMTSERKLAEVSLRPPAPVLVAQIAPKNDGLFVLSEDGRATIWRLDNPHPETSLGSILAPTWYEGYPEPSLTWQSSSATDDFEPKLSLVPLIFGTIKATLYSMLFAVPIALFAAIYTSEFLDKRYRAPLKSSIEMMASLPSVVLGFLAALILAPVVENWVLAVLSVFAVGPVAALLAGHMWQALPGRFTRALGGHGRLAALLLVVTASVLMAPSLAGPAERALFSGDFKAWLDGRVGTPIPGLALLAWPAVIVALLAADQRYLAPRRRIARGSISRAAVLNLLMYMGLLALSVFLAWFLALVGTALGLDARDLLLGTYVQRNALIVGFVMGFAVIPIIYTIAEDALYSVPQTLRSASLGCGATQWQTATRVILPVAASGIFSALMVGLGRAVGETMIVLMAAGNTPLIDLNIFNGLRTLSANIAVELPEAVKDGTLYRMLFLAALVLFMLTFVVNTVAEIIRLRFRKRAYQL